MEVPTINELLCLTRIELIELYDAVSSRLTALPLGSERDVALAVLANIRIALARREAAALRRGLAPPAP